ncbi:MAG: SpoIIE family protein phosphatase [Planctomycetota bacterium]
MTGAGQLQGDKLIIRHELRLVDTVELTGSSLSIGRSSQCDIRLPHEAVSRHHAQLEKRDDGWHIRDLDSVNGIRVNGRKKASADLSPGDVIEVRPFAMHFLGDAVDGEDRSVNLAASCERPTIVGPNRPSGQVLKQRLNDLYALASLVIHRKDNGSFWHEIHAALQRSLAAERCVLLGRDEAAGFYRLAPRARPTDPASPLVISRSVLNDVIETKRGALVQRVADHDRYAAAESLADSGVGSVICVPVLVCDQTKAIVYAERREGRAPFTADDLDFVTAAVDMAAAAVDMDELQVQARELSRLQGRVETGRELQKMLLPSPLPQPSWCRVAARNIPADQMSGDIYGVSIDRQGRLVLSLSDVSGKGVPAAFVTAILQNTLSQALLDIDDLHEIVQRINGTLDGYNLPACFATMILCRFEQDGSAVEIANAGHHAPLWITDSGSVEAFPDRIGLPLGISREWSGQIVRRDTSGDRVLLLSSDGATEAKDTGRVEFGLDRLGDAFQSAAAHPPEEIVAELADRVRLFCEPNDPEDDVTLVVMKRGSSAEGQ